MDHMGKEMALVEQADKPSSVNLIYSLRWKVKSCYEASVKIYRLYRSGMLRSLTLGALSDKDNFLEQIIPMLFGMTSEKMKLILSIVRRLGRSQSH